VAQARGHIWTVAPLARQRIRPFPLPRYVPWSEVLQDREVGQVRLTGALHRPAEGSDHAVVVVHGVGGDIDSHYVQRAAIAAARARVTCLRLNMRGADLSGADFYHAGLTADIHAAVTSEALRRYRRISVVGYSLGGHLALRYALDRPDPRLSAVAAIGAPLDLSRASRDIDSPTRLPYRAYVIDTLRAMARAVARRRPLPVPFDSLKRLRRFREWDDLLIAPRFRFADAEDYYARVSVAPDLHRLRLPALYVGAPHDPMVHPRAVEPGLRHASSALEAHWVRRGGHVGFPPDVDLGQAASPGLESQVLAWLGSRVG
jgi:predicted alpha/beta-fold hydrolase